MKIERVEVFHVAMPLVEPFRTAFGDEREIESVLVRVSFQGLHGWGESSPMATPAYSPESARTAFLVIARYLIPLLLGKEVSSGQELQRLLAPVKGNYFAKAALDNAWWDLYSKSRAEPLWKTLGGNREIIEVGADFGVMESVEALLRAIEGAIGQGYKRVKLKYRPGWELDMIDAVRKTFPDHLFHVDCNSAYTLDDREMLKRLDEYHLAMIEQPLMHDDLVDHAALQTMLRTPICLDESITSPSKARKACEIRACGWLNIKPGRVGGLTNAVEIHDICMRKGVPCWVGGMLESSLGAHLCIALATLPNFRYPNDIFPSARFYRTDLSEPPVSLSDASCVRAPRVPGCGAEPDPRRLKRQTVQHQSFGRAHGGGHGTT